MTPLAYIWYGSEQHIPNGEIRYGDMAMCGLLLNLLHHSHGAQDGASPVGFRCFSSPIRYSSIYQAMGHHGIWDSLWLFVT